MIAVSASLMATQANEITFTAPEQTLATLDHNDAYLWGINLGKSIAPNEVITGATLVIDDINNIDWLDYNTLFIDILDLTNNIPAKDNFVIHKNDDYQWGIKDYFKYSNSLSSYYSAFSKVGVWEDNNGFFRTDDLSFDLFSNTNFSTFISDGFLGIGFDPDCFYTNTKVSLLLTTEPASVPEPATLSLLGLSLLGVSGISLIRKRK